MKIAVCISTRNRAAILEKSLDYWMKFTPDKNVRIFIVDDASEMSNFSLDTTFRFSERAGIPRVKNKCIELAYDWGADYFFLSDDDCYPIAPFADAYINSGINHLSFSFSNAYSSNPERPKPKEWNGLRIWGKTNGCMMFFTRKCFDVVGGFDTRYGLGMYEHNELTRRIYNAGLTPFPNMDIIGSENIFHSMDMHNEVKRSFTSAEIESQTKKGWKLFCDTQKSKEFIEFREK